jgi:hypothetical protein
MTLAKPWKPEYEPWRHGGWYVTNLHYPSGAVGCVSRNYDDRKWRVACHEELGTFATRNEAAHAEKGIALSETLNLIARRLDELGIALPEAAPQVNGLRDLALAAATDEWKSEVFVD